ncbi:MAG TPA: DUF4402 domain-containing protein [Sphingomicrobium sp.]|nr:DUF4402 domain-containing protein [Sphingomicrobium sp.]
MVRSNHLALLALVAAAAAAPVSAQCRLCEQPTTARPQDQPSGDVDLQVETNLSFDRLIIAGAGAGAASIRPDGATGVEGAVVEISPRAMVGTVLVHGEPNRALRVEMPGSIKLYSLSGGRISVDQLGTDLSGMPRLDSAGNLTFRFGGRLQISGDADGEYRGDVPITVEYL